MCVHSVQDEVSEIEPPLWFKLAMIALAIAAVGLTVFGFIRIVR